MTIEFQFKSVTIPLAELQDIYPDMFSVSQPYSPTQKKTKRRRPRKKRETVAHLIDALIDVTRIVTFALKV